MVIAGIALGVATMRARVLPRWTGGVLVLGMILMTVAAALPEIAQTFAAGVRDARKSYDKAKQKQRRYL